MTFFIIIKTLFITMGIFHVPVLFKIPSKKFWILVDYLWVTLSFLGVASMNYETSTTIAKKTITYNTELLEQNYKHLMNYNKSLTGRNVDSPLENANIFKARGDYEYMKALYNYYDSLNILLDSNYKSIIIDKEYDKLLVIKNYVDSNPDKKLKFYTDFKSDDEKTMKYMVDDYKENEELAKKIEDEESSRFLLKYFGPILLSIGIGIRISKVSAQLRGIA